MICWKSLISSKAVGVWHQLEIGDPLFPALGLLVVVFLIPFIPIVHILVGCYNKLRHSFLSTVRS